jgi:WD40 repeat protein
MAMNSVNVLTAGLFSLILTALAAAPPARADDPNPLPRGALARLGTYRLRAADGKLGAAFLAEGQELATAGPGGLIRIWNPRTGRLLRHVGGDGRPFVLSPTNLATADGWPRLGFTIFSADGRTAAVMDNGDGASQTWVTWNLTTGKALGRGSLVRQRWGAALALLPDGKALLSARDSGAAVWDVTRQKAVCYLDLGGLDQARVAYPDLWPPELTLAPSPDGVRIASAVWWRTGEDQRTGRALLWDATTGKELRRIELPAVTSRNIALANFNPPALSPDGKRLALAAPDGTLQLRDLETGREVAEFVPPKDLRPAALLFSPDGRRLVAWGEAGIHLLDPATGKLTKTLGDSEGRFDVPDPPLMWLATVAPSWRLTISRDGRLLARNGQGGLRIWDLDSGKPIGPPAEPRGAVLGVRMSADGKTVTTLGPDAVRRWDAAGKELSCVPPPEFRRIHAILPDGATAVYIDTLDGKDVARVWKVFEQKQPGEPIPLPVRQGSTYGMNPEGRVVLEDWDGTWQVSTIRLWDATTQKELVRLEEELDPAGHGNAGLPFAAVVPSTGGGKVLTIRHELWRPPGIGDDGAPRGGVTVCRVGVWDAATSGLVRRWKVIGELRGAALTPDGRSVVLATSDEAGLWEVATGRKRCAFPAGATVVAVAPDGRTLALARGPAAQLVDLRTGKEVARLEGHQEAVLALSFGPRGQTLVTGSGDTTAMIWDAAGLVAAARPRPSELSAEQLDGLWKDLAGDSANAFLAGAALQAAPRQTAALLRERVRPATASDARPSLQQLLRQLDSDSPDRSDQAARELARRGVAARPAVAQALAGVPPGETRRRLKAVLWRCGVEPEPPGSGAELRPSRAIEVLEGLGTPEALEVLESLAKGHPEAPLTQEAAAALKRARN